MSQKSDFLKHLRTNIIFVSFSEFVPKMHGPKMHFIRYWFQWSANPSARPLIQKIHFLNERTSGKEGKGRQTIFFPKQMFWEKFRGLFKNYILQKLYLHQPFYELHLVFLQQVLNFLLRLIVHLLI